MKDKLVIDCQESGAEWEQRGRMCGFLRGIFDNGIILYFDGINANILILILYQKL